MTSPKVAEDQTHCPEASRLKAWLDERAELDSGEISHLHSCPACNELLSNFTDAPELFATSVNGHEGRESYRDEKELRILQENLARVAITPDRDELSTIAQFYPAVTPGSNNYSTVNHLHAEDISPSEETELSSKWLQAHMPDERYSILRKLATGGSGAVYLAYDNKLSRDVAIKVLVRQSPRDRQRMLREAKILAELDHPNVVRIFDVDYLKFEGLDDHNRHAPVYMVMEYLAGGSIESNKATDFNRIDFNRIAHWLEQAAAGLASAHQRGLVHRDIKPANLLTDSIGNVLKVADFGLARALDANATHVTRTGEIVGTPAYMSPEQLRIDDEHADAIETNQPNLKNDVTIPRSGVSKLSVSTDIYSLGATLYHLLTGQPPFLGSTAAVLRQIPEVDPVRPRVLSPRIPIDLETICLHAMEKLQENRYHSIEDFRWDLRRFMDGAPIEARPVTFLQRSYRYLGRHRAIAAALGAVAALTILLFSGSLLAAVIFSNQNAKLRAAVQQASSDRLAAEQSLRKSIEAADQLLVSVADDADLLPSTPGSQQLSRQLLRRAENYYQSFLTANADNALLNFELAKAHLGLAKIAAQTDTAAETKLQTEKAIELLRKLAIDITTERREFDVSARQVDLLWAEALIVQANVLKEASKAREAMQSYDEALSRLQSYTASNQSIEEALASKVSALRGLAEAQILIGNAEDALPQLSQSIEILDQLRAINPDQTGYLRDAALTQMTYATTAIDRGQLLDGKQRLLTAIELLNQVDATDKYYLRVNELSALVQTNLGLTERRLGNTAEAKRHYDEAISINRRLIELEPTVSSHKWNLVVASLNSGGPELDLGRPEPLVERWRDTVPILNALVDQNPDNKRYPQVRAMLNSNIAIVLRDLGKYEEAIAPLKQATDELYDEAIRLEKAPEAYLPVAVNHYELASTFLQLQRYGETLASLDASDQIVDELLASHPDFTPARGHRLDTMLTRFQVSDRQGIAPAAELLLSAEESVELAKTLIEQNPNTFDYKLDLAEALIHQSIAGNKLENYAASQANLDAAIDHLEILNNEQSQADVDRLLKKALTVSIEQILEQLESSRGDNKPSESVISRSDLLELLERRMEAAREMPLDEIQMREFEVRLKILSAATR